jgi:hypothetical protein
VEPYPYSSICLRGAHRDSPFFITVTIMVDIYIILGLHILDVMTIWGCAVEQHLSSVCYCGARLVITKLDGFPGQKNNAYTKNRMW